MRDWTPQPTRRTRNGMCPFTRRGICWRTKCGRAQEERPLGPERPVPLSWLSIVPALWSYPVNKIHLQFCLLIYWDRRTALWRHGHRETPSEDERRHCRDGPTSQEQRGLKARPEPRRWKGTDLPHPPPRNQRCRQLDLELPDSRGDLRTTRQYSSVVLNHVACGTLLRRS